MAIRPRARTGCPTMIPTSAIARPGRPRIATVGQRWRFRRNLVIYLAYRHGASQRLLADVFDLPRSRISAIIEELRAMYAEGGED